MSKWFDGKSAEQRAASRWPDAVERLGRREALHAALDDYLDKYIIGDGGWALAEKEDISGLRMLINEIIDLKFERDPDGDAVVDYQLVNRRTHLLKAFAIPNHPREHKVDEYDLLVYQQDILSAAGWMTSLAADLTKTVEREMRERLIRLQEERKADARLTSILNEIDSDMFGSPKASKLLADFETEFKRKLDEVPLQTRLEEIRNKIGQKSPDDVRALRNELSIALDKYEESDPDDRAREHPTYMLLSGAYKSYGRNAFRAEIDRFNLIGEKRRQARKKVKL